MPSRPDSRILRALLVLAFTLIPSTTIAQTKPASKPSSAPSPEPSQAEARQRFNEGIALADAGDHEAARLKFDQAWLLLKSPAVLYNLARAEQLSGHLVEALEHYRLFNRMASDPKVTDTQRQRAKENIAELSKKVGQIEIDAPASARVSIDGHPVDTSSGDAIAVATGTHVVEAIVDGSVKRVTVEAQPGTITKAKPEGESSAPSSGTAATAPTVKATTTPETPPVTAHDEGLLTPRNIVAGALGGAALIAGGVALGFLVDSNAKDTAAKDSNTSLPGGACAQRALASCADYTAKLDDASSSRTVSYVAFATAGVFALGAIAAFTLWPKAKGTDSAVRPAIHGGTVGVIGEF
jgi:hypothetical protein